MNGPIASRTLALVLRFYVRSAWYSIVGTVGTSDSGMWGARLGPVEVAGHHLVLRSPRLNDAAQWREVRLREQAAIERWWVTSPLGWAERHSEMQWVSHVLQGRRDARAGRALPLVVEVDGQFAGEFSLESVDALAGTAELSAWMDSAWVREGLSGVAAGLLIDHAMTELGLHRITAPICEGNIGAMWGARRIGMRREGRMVGFLHVGGERRNHDLWAVTADRMPPGGLAPGMIRAAAQLSGRRQCTPPCLPAATCTAVKDGPRE